MYCSLPDGSEFRGDGLNPWQHIYRIVNPAWLPARILVIISKFRVQNYIHDNVPYWSPYDLLGCFLSSIGEAPYGATKRNFYLPVTAMYGKWCNQLGSPEEVMFQCTWRSQGGQRDVFFLGASLSGYRAPKAQTGIWKHVVHWARFRLIDSEVFRLTNWNFNCITVPLGDGDWAMGKGSACVLKLILF